jgi:putative ABC transport system permease protein
MSGLLQDLRYAGRGLRKAWGFTILIAGVIAIGIGANSVMFSLVDAALVRPLPFAHPEQLMMLWEHPPGYAYNRVSPLTFIDWSEQNDAFTSMAAVAGGSRTLTGAGGAAEKIPGQAVTSTFFDVFGVRPIAGRTFTAADAAERAYVVVLSEPFWRNRFGGDPALIGRTIMLDSQPYAVVGIAPAAFQALYRADMWTLITPRRTPEQRRMHYLQVVGRAKPGVDVEHARGNMSLVASDIARLSPDTNKDWTVTIEPLREALVGSELRTTSLVLAGTVGFVLLMACANVANLLLARGLGRAREIAVRAALGGSRNRILRQLLTESVLLACLGGAAGLALAWALLRVAPALMPPGTLPPSVTLAFDTRLLAFTSVLTLVTGVLFGLAPAWQASRLSLSAALGTGGRGATGGGGWLRATLATSQIAVAVLLVSGATLLARTLVSLSRVDPGYHAANVLTMRVGLPFGRYPQSRVATFYQSVERALGDLPGVRAAAVGTNLPLDGWDIGQGFHVIGEPVPDKANQPSAHYQMVGTRYFETLGIPLVRGRAFTDRDTAASTQVCIVNEEFVRRYLKTREPIGTQVSVQAMDLRGPTPVVRDIVGVIHQVKVEGPGEKQNTVEIYVPIAQNAWDSASIAVQTAGDPLALLPAVKAAIARLDSDLPLTQVRTMDDVASEAVARPRFRAQLIGAFAILALALAAAGVCGVLAFAVGQRVREFGIRRALGAQAGDILGLVLAGGARMLAAGLVLGLGAAAVLTRYLASLLFGVQPLDPISFVAAPIVLTIVAVIACAAPAWRAARVDPSVALRQD